jgi:hypothetical protein
MEETLSDLASHFDHHSAALGRDPYPVFEEMRSKCPVAHSDQYGGFWVVSDYENVRRVLKDFRVFTNTRGVTIPSDFEAGRRLPLEADPPEHTKYRALMAPVFSTRRIAALEPRLREHCNRLIDSFIDRGECEFVSEFARPFPSIVFTEMMGLPYDEAPKFQKWVHDVIHGRGDDPSGELTAKAVGDVVEYMSDLLEVRKLERGDDILSVLLDARYEQEALTEKEMLDLAFLLFIAGLDTVTNSLSLSFSVFAERPELRDQLVSQPSLVPSAVEEMLRYESLVPAGRVATEDVEIGGVQLKAGDRLLCNTLSADRDPAQFPEADAVVLDREPNRHLAFSVGPHRCLGSHLARLELQVVLEVMHERIPDYHLRPNAPKAQRFLNQLAGISEVPLAWSTKP